MNRCARACAVGALVCALAGCKDEAPAGAQAAQPVQAPDASAGFVPEHSCDQRANAGVCLEYAGGEEREQHQRLCEAFDGTFADGGCPSERVVGLCELGRYERKRYYEGTAALSFTAMWARDNCQSQPVRGRFVLP